MIERVRYLWPALLLLALAATVRAAEPDPAAIERAYEPEIRPLLAQYCHDCHGPKKTEADVDLAALATWSDARRHVLTLQKMAEMLASGQMPPKDAPRHPTAGERKALEDWLRGFLTLEAAARAGDPGRVVLRRLSNAEYTYTLRDLTGVASLDPAREFPVDGAAGEGFTNTGSALVMSPALVTKYLDAAKEVASHAVLTPDGFRFSPGTTRRDWTNELLAEIRGFYAQFTDARGGDRVNLQGIVFDTNTGGRLPLEDYLAATLAERESLTSGKATIADVARRRGLNAKYLGLLWSSLTSREPSLLLDGLRARWGTARPEDAPALAAEIGAWQKGLWRFATVGHIGKVGGPKSWLEPVSPLVSKQDFRFKLPAAEGDAVTLSLIAADAGDGSDHDFVVWQQPRLVAPGRPDLLLRDVRAATARLTAARRQIFADTAKYLSAAAEAQSSPDRVDAKALAGRHRVDDDALRAWIDYLGIGAGEVQLSGHFTAKLSSAAGYDFIRGWGSHDTPLLLANSSDQHVRVPGNMPPHSVAVHPSPKVRAAVAWQSPVAASMRIEGTVTHAHPECGNGVAWTLELRHGKTRRRLASGAAQGAKPAAFGPLEGVTVQKGDVVALLVGPRDGNHACDLTTLDLRLASGGERPQTWRLADDVAGDVLAANPHADRFGNENVWHFYTEADQGSAGGEPVIPADSLLAKWLAATDEGERSKLAGQMQGLLSSPPPAAKDSPDGILYKQLASLGGPLFRRMLAAPQSAEETSQASGETNWGLDPARFGKHPSGSAREPADLCVHAPAAIEIRLPAELVEGYELVTAALLDKETGGEGSVQVDIVAGKASAAAGLRQSQVQVTAKGGQWTADNRQTSYASPILVQEGSTARQRIEGAMHEFRQLFPAALCYTKIVPVDEVVTLTLFYREDEHLVRLMLDDNQRQRLDRLWDELHFVSQDALTLVDALAQLIEYATQDADPKVFEPLRQPFAERAAAYRQRLIDCEPRQVEALLDFAGRSYRRPLAAEETDQLRSLYASLRQEELSHEEAFRLTLARILVAPAFLYHIERPGPGAGQSPVTDFELASRLSYFLWSSQPDDELRSLAAAGKLSDPAVLLEQTRRMLQDAKTRRLATEFACQWLHIHDFDHLDEKSDRHFPTFVPLRGAMYEESIQFFTDLFQHDRSVLGILDADYTFLNEQLAAHYGIPGVRGDQWRRVEGVKQYARGGILAQATTLSKQSGASRTSPILRGNWISEVLLGERLPRPPKGVPPLPDEPPAEGLSMRQIVEKHTSDERCSVCHLRIDPLGFALEGFDAIGRRHQDAPLADTQVKTIDGAEFAGLDGLRGYLAGTRREAFLRQFCKKLLGYSLGRSVQLSDEPLLAKMCSDLAANDYRVQTAIEAIVQSRQFREIRGRDSAYDD